MKRTPTKPTPTELSILKILWTRGPSTVREVYDELSKTKPTGYTSVLKIMQIMAEKGSVRRNLDQRAHIYEADQPQEQTKGQLVRDLIERAFSGSASQLVMHALADKPASREEIKEIRRILDDHERGSK